MSSNEQKTQIRGLMVSLCVGWFRKTYGEAAYQQALSALPEEEKSQFSRYLLGIGWYPMESWLRFLRTQAQVAISLGEAPSVYETRVIREAGGVVIQKVFQTVLARSNPQSMVSRIPMMYNFFFDHGGIEIRENIAGKAVLAIQTLPDMKEYIQRFLVPGLSYFFELVSACNVGVACTNTSEQLSVATYTYT